MEVERDAVHAVALAGRVRSVVEDMAEMPAAPAAVDFGSRHEEAAVGFGSDCFVERCPEAGPAGAAVEFGVGRKQQLPAAGAMVEPGPILLVERARPGALCAVLPQHPILCRRQFAPPLLLIEGNRKCLFCRVPAATQSAEQALCHAFPFGLKVHPLGYRVAGILREEDVTRTDERDSVHSLV